MSYDYGPLQTYEVTWKSGHVESIQGHQTIFESGGFMDRPNPRFMIHGEFDGHWRLMLCAPEDDVLSIRNVTEREVITPEVQP